MIGCLDIEKIAAAGRFSYILHTQNPAIYGRIVGVANQQMVEEWKGYAEMFDALMEIVEPQVKLREKKVRKEGIRGTVDVLKELGHGETEIKTVIIKKYGLSADEAGEYF